MRDFLKPISSIGPLPEEGSKLRRLGNVHWGPLAAALLLSVVGIATVHSATAELGGDFLLKQALRVSIGLVALAIVLMVDYRVWINRGVIFYGLGLASLVLVLLVGHTAKGARSWLALGSVGIQPSELAKLATALVLAWVLGRIRRSHLSVREVLIAAGVVGLPMLLVAMESDLGSAAMFIPMLAGALWVCGIRWQHLALAAGVALLLAIALWSFGLKDYQRDRIVSFLSPGSDPLGAGYQVRQSKIAVGSGELLGRGYGQGTQSQLRFLPERHTDFIMAVLAEEWGFLGVMTVLGLYALYIAAATRVAMRARDRAGMLLIVALLSLLIFHIIYNTAMVVGLLPVTGIPLPFLSYGGSFTLMVYLSTGLILNVDYRRYVNR